MYDTRDIKTYRRSRYPHFVIREEYIWKEKTPQKVRRLLLQPQVLSSTSAHDSRVRDKVLTPKMFSSPPTVHQQDQSIFAATNHNLFGFSTAKKNPFYVITFE